MNPHSCLFGGFDSFINDKERSGESMSNFVLFFNSFFSYLLLMAVVVVIAGVAVFLGIKMRKNKNSQAGNEKTQAGA